MSRVVHHRLLAVFCLTALLVFVAATAAAAEPPPVADFFRRPQVTSMTMSPDGKSIAGVIANKNGRMQLVVIDLANPGRSKVIASFVDADVRRAWWVNDARLVFDLTDRTVAYALQRGTGLFAVPKDGLEGPRRLIKGDRRYFIDSAPKEIVDRALSWDHVFAGALRDGSDDVLVEHLSYSNTGQPQGAALLRLDTRTGRARSLSDGAPEHVFAWKVDRTGAPRAAYTVWDGRDRLYVRASAEKPWVQIREGASFGLEADVPYPLFITGDDSLYLRARHGRDVASLERLSMSELSATPATLMALDGYDFTGSPVFDRQGNLLGLRYLTDAWTTHWFDPTMKALQSRIDALLPTTINWIECGDCERPKTVLVGSRSDHQPLQFRLFDFEAGTFAELPAARPWIVPSAMARVDVTRFSARDGLSIPVQVTRPVGVTGAAPMVVLVHGGPWRRGTAWGWDPDAQFLASRGYVVVEPEFRGSVGYGRQLFFAGFRQWGLAMQDDLTDAAQWAVKQGYADPARICIAGGDYGGYATLMGLARDPNLFRCGFEWVGVTDIDLMYSIHWSDASEMWKDYGMPALIGDRDKDAAQLAATSPIRLASKIRQPLLMAYGRADMHVPIDHGTQFRDAVKVHNPNVEWIVYPDEGHGWMLEADDIDFWTHVERFLDRNLKNPR